MFVHREVELTRKLELGKEEYTKKAIEADDLSRQLRKVQVCVCVRVTHMQVPAQDQHAVCTLGPVC